MALTAPFGALAERLRRGAIGRPRLAPGGGQGRFRRNFLSLFKANVVGQFLLLAAMPVLTRFYTPSEFGVLAVFVSLLTTAEALVVWRFNQAVPNARALASSAALMLSGALVAFALAAALAALIALLPDTLDRLDGYRRLDGLERLLPLAVLMTGLRLLLHAWYVRVSEMRIASRARIGYVLAYLVGCAVMVALGRTAEGLVAATTFALGASTILLWEGTAPLRAAVRRLTLGRWLTVTRASLAFVSEAALVGFVNLFSLSLAVLLLAERYDAASLGLYSLLLSMVVVPARTFTQALALSFWSRAAELARAGRFGSLRRLYLKVTGIMALLALAIAAVCLASPVYLVPLLGADWVGADRVLQVLIPLIAGIVMFSATNHLVVLKLQRLQLFADGLRIALLVVAIVLAHRFDWAFTEAVFAMACASLLGHVALGLCHLAAYRRLARTGTSMDPA